MPFRQQDTLELHRARTGWCVAAIAAITIGCGGTNKRPDVPPDAAVVDAATPVDASEGMDAAVTMIVHGTGTFHDVTDTGPVDHPRDFSEDIFASFTPAARGFERRTGTGAADGTFAVPVGVGAAAWQLELGVDQGDPRSFLVSSAARLDLSVWRLGRPDRRFPSLPTAVTLNATGLSPWRVTDEVGIMSANAGALVLRLETSLPLAPGDTAITGQVIPWTTALIEAAKGDTTMMFQLVDKTPAGFPGFYVALARSGPASGFTMVNGSPATMTVALADVPQSSTLAVHVKRSQFEALRTQVGPGALPSGPGEQSLFIHALPQLRTRGFFASAPRLVVSLPDDGALDYDQTFSYGNPFTTGGVAWDEFAVARHNFTVPVLAAGATTPFNVQVGFTSRIPIPVLSVDGTIAPALTPVRNVKIAGMDLGTPQTGVGGSPTITWDPPATATATRYNVGLHQVIANGPVTTLRWIAAFDTTSTSLQFPDSMLSSGGSYILVIDASAIPGYDPATPFTSGGLSSFVATSVTAQFTP